MSDTSSGGRQSGAKQPTKQNGRGKDALPSDGILANLPRTRPQRGSARREAARLTATEQAKPVRQASETKAKPAPKAEPPRKQTTAKKRPSRAKLTAKPAQDPAPRQGFEAESDQLSGPVQPPGGIDMFASAAELAGELTKSGLSAGGRLLKDALARLPLN